MSYVYFPSQSSRLEIQANANFVVLPSRPTYYVNVPLVAVNSCPYHSYCDCAIRYGSNPVRNGFSNPSMFEHSVPTPAPIPAPVYYVPTPAPIPAPVPQPGLCMGCKQFPANEPYGSFCTPECRYAYGHRILYGN